MLADFGIKFGTITPLAQQVVELGKCPRCHKSTLRHLHSCEHFRSWQCTGCKHVFMIEPASSYNTRDARST